MRKSLSLAPLALIGALSACASVTSSPEKPNTAVGDGLVYHLPMRAIAITVTVGDAADELTPSVAAGETYPDMSTRYVLKFNRNLVGKNKLTVGINEKGLLTSANAETTSQVSEAMQSLAASAGAIKGLEAGEACKPKTTYATVYRPESARNPKSLCGLSIQVTRLAPDTAATSARTEASSSDGIFYRQAEPYLVQIGGDGKPMQSFITYSPSKAPTAFLPVGHSLFATTNKATFAFTEGMPTSYEQDLDGEAPALLKLPADVLGAYFQAVGKTFGDRKTDMDNERQLLDARNQLALAKLKAEACREAVVAKDQAKIEAACGE